MKSVCIIFLCFAVLAVTGFAADTVSADSSSRAKSVDEDLILDEGTSTVLPAEKKAVVQSTVVDSPARAKSAVAPAPAPIKTPVVTPAPSAAPAAPVAAPMVAPVRPAVDTIAAKQPPPAPQKTSAAVPKAADTVKKLIDEDLILDGGEEDLLGQAKKPAVKSAGASGVAPVGTVPDSSAAKQGAAPGAGTPDTTSGQAASGVPEQKYGTKVSSEPPPRAPAAAVKIENARSINFAANLKEYRSPKLAMLMSLVVPGSGQVYAKSNLWAAGFLVVEAAIVGTGLIYSSKSKVKKVSAHKFADTMYDADKFETYTQDLRSNLTQHGDTGDVYSSIFFDSSDVQFLNDAKKGPGNRSDNFYNDISSETSPYIQGWKDAAPVFTENGFSISDTNAYHEYSIDSNYYVYRNGNKADYRFGFSDNQVRYNGMLDDSRRLANISRTAFITLLVNHLASAVMAGIEAKNHNDALLGKETLWRHIGVEQQFVNTGSETVSGYAVGVRF